MLSVSFITESFNSAHHLKQGVAYSNCSVKTLCIVYSGESILPVLFIAESHYLLSISFIAESQYQPIVFSCKLALDNMTILILKRQSNENIWLSFFH
jgi:hypothetical protein